MRQQRPRGTTRREAVIEAALSVVDEVGTEGLTIRAVAGVVGAPPMSLYTHFANKEALLDLMHREIMLRLYRDSGEASWRGELAAFAAHVRSTLLSHPRWTPLLTRPAPPIHVPMRDRLLSLMVADGIAPEQALRGMAATMLTSLGLTFIELNFREADGASSLQRRFEVVKSGMAEQEPAISEPTTRAAFAAARFDLAANFQLAISSLIEGFASSCHASTLK
jgi:AcrR family transcriptional regulator